MGIILRGARSATHSRQVNELVTFYRQQFPDDPKSDDEITLDVAKELTPDVLGTFPNALKDLERLNAPHFTPGQYAQQFGGELIRGAAGTVASIPESIAIGASVLNKILPLDEDIPADQDLLYQQGAAIRKAGEAISPAPVPGLEKSFLASKLPQGIGSAGAFVATGAVSKLLNVPRWLGIAGAGAMAGASQGYQDAKEKGANEVDRINSSMLNGLAGLSEAAPLEHILSRAEKWSGGKLWKAVLDAGAGGLEEGLQNAFQGEAGNQIAKRIVGYDKDREEFKDLLENTEVGGAVGGLVSLMASAVGMHLNRLKNEEPKKVEKVEKAVPGITSAPPPAAAVVPTVTIPNQDVVENYLGTLTPERKEELSRIAQNKIETGVDLSSGLPPQDQAAVRIIEGILRQGKTDQEAANVTANLQAMSVPDLIAQRDVMVKQGFDPAQISEVNKIISEKGGEQNAESVLSNEVQVPQGGAVSQVGGTEGGQNLQLPPEAGTETSQSIQRLAPTVQEPQPVAEPTAPAVQSRLVNPSTSVTMTAQDPDGNELTLEMTADEAYRRLNRRKTAFEMLIDCLGR